MSVLQRFQRSNNTCIPQKGVEVELVPHFLCQFDTGYLVHRERSIERNRHFRKSERYVNHRRVDQQRAI